MKDYLGILESIKIENTGTKYFNVRDPMIYILSHICKNSKHTFELFGV
jgi:hypothetical protein